MPIIALLVRLLIAVTFSVAGISKLANLQRTQKGIREFGIPDWAAAPLRVVLPLAELAAAGLLVPAATVLWGALGAIVLLIAFIVGIGINLSLGRKPDCNCFGQLHSEPIGWPTLVRNGVLLGGAALVLWQWRRGSTLSLFNSLTGLSKIELAELLLGAALFAGLAAGVWFAFHLLRQNGRLLLRMDALEKRLDAGGIPQAAAQAHAGPSVGSPAPYFALPPLSGEANVSLQNLIAERRPVLLIFSDPDCGPCSSLLPEIARWEREHARTLTFALISRGSPEANRKKLGNHSLKHVLLQKERETAAAYQANGTPSGILIGANGTVASPLAIGSQAIANLVEASSKNPPSAALPANGANGKSSAVPAGVLELRIGDPAPHLALPDLSGKIIDLAALRRRETVVLFWNPSCGFCAKMLPDIRQWEERRGAEAPQLLVVSSGSVDANRSMGFRSPVVLDQNFASGQAFRVRGTPSAVLVDAEGKIASGVANGAQAVLTLANTPHRRSAFA